MLLLQDVDLIFSNIEDIAEMSVKLISMIEEAFEMVDDDQNSMPLIGNCFEDLAEVSAHVNTCLVFVLFSQLVAITI